MRPDKLVIKVLRNVHGPLTAEEIAGRLEIEGISGTSAGAMNGVVMADALTRGDREDGRGDEGDCLRREVDRERLATGGQEFLGRGGGVGRGRGGGRHRGEGR